MRFALDWRFEGPAAPYLVAIDKGYYKAEGLNVSIDPGSGSVEGINRVASGAYDVGFCDINLLVKYRDNPRNLPVKMVMMVYDTPAFSIITLKKNRHLQAEGSRGPDPRRAGGRRRLGAVADLRAGEQDRRRQGEGREHRLPGARADARAGQGRRDHRLLVLLLHEPQGAPASRRRHRRAA